MAPSGGNANEGCPLELEESDRIEVLESFEPLDKLISQGINAGDVKKLQDAEIYTCYGLVMRTKKSCKGIKGLSEAKVNEIREAAEKHLQESFEFEPIDKLNTQGICAGEVKKLHDAGTYIYKKSLTGIKGLSEPEVEKNFEAAEKLQGLAVSAECAIKMSKQAMPLAGARAVSRTGGGQSWSLLHRVVFFVDPDGVDQEGHHFGHDEGLSEPTPIPPGVEFCINRGPLVDGSLLPEGALREKIPHVSMVILNCSLLSDSSGKTISGLVKCTDPTGNILIEVSQGPGTERLLVCRPGNGTARCLPPVPGSLGVQSSGPCCAGIVFDPSGGNEDFIVVQLVQSTSFSSSSSHTPKAMHAVCFTSRDDSWTIKQLRGGQKSNFKADTVLSHNNGSIIFVDQEYGMLIFDPVKQDKRIVRFPEGAEVNDQSDSEIMSIRRCVGSSEGHLWHVLVHDMPSAPKVTVWLLDEADHWKHKLCINMDDVWNCSVYKNSSLPIGQVADVAFVHPMNSNKVFQKCCASPLDMYPWVFQDPDRCPTGSAKWHTLLLKAIKGSKSLAKFGWRTLKKNRRLLAKAPAAVELIGWGIGSPYPVMPFLRAGADVVMKIGQAIDFEEAVSSRFLRTSSIDYKVVGTMKEAEEVIVQWKRLGKPANMAVQLAPGLSDGEEVNILNHFINYNSEDLLFVSGWTIL